MLHLVVPTVGDMGQLPSSLPGLALPDVPLSLETLFIGLNPGSTELHGRLSGHVASGH